ncbi:hypothetical protein GGR54DRAFT_92676 [Hypoxylon sp. NC1633]|nr:hypothetical protein GGR54DRAFT_92676 [Hypoxylon sp. NC1633]
MGGQFTEYDDERCPHYAQFAANLNRVDFDVIYWLFFFTVIGILFVASWIYQSTMIYRDKPGYREDKFRKKLKASLAWCTVLFLVAAVMLVIEVYALLALQFCDGEDLMSLYWSTWTMLQLGSEIAILGIDLALWHHIYDIRHPLWALALGTPVLVVAGFGHVMQLALRMFYKRARARRRARKASASNTANNSDSEEKTEGEATQASSSSNSIKPEVEQIDDRSSVDLEAGQPMYLTLDVGDDERVRQWPSFVGVAGDGKTILQLTMHADAAPAAGNNSRDSSDMA